MLFDTAIYAIFLILAVFIYWRLPWRKQNVFLLAASYLFYGWWDWRFLSLILISTIVDYQCARIIARSGDVLKRRTLLSISVGLNLAFLGFFKYFNFFADSLATALGTVGIDVSITLLRIVLPPGISFYTFQELAYIVDVYRKKMEPADSLVDYALFITLFPHLIAGPIQRPSHLLPQVQKPRVYDSRTVFDGLMLIMTGLFRKCVVADNCALLANAAFSGKLGEQSAATLAIGTYAFAWQIYGDFSGYSDIARGSAQLMGFHFMVNFRQPYLSTSLKEFWRRWHISLSTWLRDYLYIVLGGNRETEPRVHRTFIQDVMHGGPFFAVLVRIRPVYRNLMTTMLLGGLWHGANWTFVVWGGIHGLGLVAERILGAPKAAGPSEAKVQPGADAGLLSLGPWARRIVIFHLVCLAWIFFRAESMSQAFSLLSGLGHWSWRPEYAVAFQFLAAFAIPMFVYDLLLERRQEEYLFEKFSPNGFPAVRIAYGVAMLGLVTLFSANQANAFIYFQF
ncbi:MAG: MBOAT family protein [Acidobacteria bacterium]|nr:MBOAT family protein [Acidobacteriota bacterium]